MKQSHLQNQLQIAGQLLNSVMHPTAHKRDIRHDDEGVIQFQSSASSRFQGADQSKGKGKELNKVKTVNLEDWNQFSDDDSSSVASYYSTDSELTPLSSDDDNKNNYLKDFCQLSDSINKLSCNVESLDTEHQQEEFVRPGIVYPSKENFERAGVLHLVHSWHMQAQTGPNV